MHVVVAATLHRQGDASTITAATGTLADIWRLYKVHDELCISSGTGEWRNTERQWLSQRLTETFPRAPSPKLCLCPAGCKTCSPAIGDGVGGSRDTLEHSTTKVLLRIELHCPLSPAPA